MDTITMQLISEHKIPVGYSLHANLAAFMYLERPAMYLGSCTGDQHELNEACNRTYHICFNSQLKSSLSYG